MTELLHVSEEFYETLEARRRDGESMEETLRRLVGGPRPEEVAGIVSSETAEKMRERLDRKETVGVADKRELRERFE